MRASVHENLRHTIGITVFLSCNHFRSLKRCDPFGCAAVPSLSHLQCPLEGKGRGHADACCIELLTNADVASFTAGDTAGDDW